MQGERNASSGEGERDWEVQVVGGQFQIEEVRKEPPPPATPVPQPPSQTGLLPSSTSQPRASLLDSQSPSRPSHKSKPSHQEPPQNLLQSHIQNLSEEDSTVNQNRIFTPIHKHKANKVEPNFVTKYQESVSVESRDERVVQKKIDRLEGHMRKLEERQRRLELMEVKMEEEILKVQTKSELFPRITENQKIKPVKPFRITSRLVSLTLENPSTKERVDTNKEDKDLLHKQILQIRDLVVSLKEMRKPEENMFPSKELQSNSQGTSHELPSLEDRTSNVQKTGDNQSNLKGYTNSEQGRQQIPSQIRPSNLGPDRNTVSDMKTVFFNGYAPTGPSRFVPISQQPQQSSSIDVHRDVFLPLNTQSKTLNSRERINSNTKPRSKISTENFNTMQKQAAREFISVRPKYDTRYDTEKRMEHQRREPIKIQVDKEDGNYRRGRRQSANPEELPSPFSQKGPIKLNIPPQMSASETGMPVKLRPNPEPKTVPPIRFRKVQVQPVQVNFPAQQPEPDMNNALDDIVIQEPQPDTPGNISNIQKIQFRTSEDLKRNLLVFPKLPQSLNPLLNSEQLVGLAREVYSLFNLPLRQKDEPSLTIKKYRNCVYFSFQNKHILWHYSGKFYIGGWEKGKDEGGKSGRGFEMVPDNYIYEGEFVSGKREGYGVLNSLKGDNYVGQWYQGLRHGKGRLEEHSGVVYDGHWKNGKKDGFGRLTFGGVEEYEGSFEDGLKHGFGREIYKNRDSYKGEYFMGRFSGQGTYKWANGAVYQGQFLNGLRHGRGIWKSNAKGKGDAYEGQYCQDKKSGQGKYTWQNGSTYQGYFSNDMKHGQGILRYSDGVVVQGIWDKGNLKVQLYNSSTPPQRKHFREEPSKKIQVSGKEFNF